MKTAISSNLAGYLTYLCDGVGGGSYSIIDIYTIYLVSGVTLRLTSWPVSITFPTTGIYGGGSVGGNTRVSGQTFLATGPFVSRSMLTQSVKLEVSTIKVELLATPAMKIGSTPVLAAIAAGQFGGATVYVDRLWCQNVAPIHWTDWQGNPQSGFDFTLGTINWFSGLMGAVEQLGRSKAVLRVSDPTMLLSSDYARNTYQTGCGHSYGDTGCGFDKSTVTVAGTVQSGSTTAVINTDLTTTDVIPSPPGTWASPNLQASADNIGVNIAAQTYYVVITYTGPAGESPPSPESSIGITGSTNPGANGTTDKLLQVNAPTSPPATATGWNVYVSNASGDEQLQQSFIGFTGLSSQFTQQQTLGQGAPPPTNAAGWFAQGLITFTSGVNSGLSATVSAYQLVGGLGVVTVSPPLLSTPAPGDNFVICPDCDKSIAKCTAYGNLIHYRGFPWLPTPENSI